MSIVSTNYFPDIIGQDEVKQKLSTFIDSYRNTNIFPHVGFIAARGHGKSLMAESIARHLTVQGSKQIKKFVKVNCAMIPSKTAFFDEIVIPHLAGQDTTLFLDEAGVLTDSVSTLLLTITEELEKPSQVPWNGTNYIFDFRRLTFLMATTEGNRLDLPLLDRFERIDFEEYTIPQLGQIVKQRLENRFEIEDGVLENIASVVRGNPRGARKMGENVKRFLLSHRLNKLTNNQWRNIVFRLAIKPMGLDHDEIKVLKILKDNKNCSLTRIAANLGLKPEAVRSYTETYLLKANLIEISKNGRNLTGEGEKYLRNLNL